jgi:hypothetical protein
VCPSLVLFFRHFTISRFPSCPPMGVEECEIDFWKRGPHSNSPRSASCTSESAVSRVRVEIHMHNSI